MGRIAKRRAASRGYTTPVGCDTIDRSIRGSICTLEVHVSWRTLSLAIALAGSLLTLPAYARTTLVAQRSSKTAPGLYLSHNLKPGHRYRLQIVSRGHRPVIGIGFQYFTYIQNRRLYVGHRPLNLRGTTPLSTTFSQPAGKKPSEWSLAENLMLRRGRGLTVRLFDLGAHK